MSEKAKGVIAYLLGFIGGLIILFGFKDSTRLNKVHAAQSITLTIAYLILVVAISILSSFMSFISFVSTLLPIAFLVLLIIGAYKAYHEEEFNIPVVSEWAVNLFGKYIDG